MSAVQLGGLPGICFVREPEARYALFQSWLETLLYKDLLIFKIPQFNPDRAYQILEACAQLHLPNLTELSRHLELDPRRVKHYLDAFSAVFVTYELPPYRGGTGKSRFCLFDSGLATHLGAPFETAALVRLINDIYSTFEAAGLKKPILQSYRSAAGSRMDLVLPQAQGPIGFVIRDTDQINPFALRGAAAFVKKYPKGKAVIFCPATERIQVEPLVEIVPWTRSPEFIQSLR